MSGHRRALVALWGGAAVLAAPWVIEWALIRLRRTTWRPPAVPRIRLPVLSRAG